MVWQKSPRRIFSTIILNNSSPPTAKPSTAESCSLTLLHVSQPMLLFVPCPFLLFRFICQLRMVVTLSLGILFLPLSLFLGRLLRTAPTFSLGVVFIPLHLFLGLAGHHGCFEITETRGGAERGIEVQDRCLCSK